MPTPIIFAGAVGGATGNLLLSGLLPLAGLTVQKLLNRNDRSTTRDREDRKFTKIASCFWFFLAIIVCYFSYIGREPGGLSTTKNFGIDASEAKIEFTKDCVKSSEVTPPISYWPLAYRLEFCGCAAARSVPRMTAEQAKAIDSKGFLNAEENQKLLIEPALACFAVMKDEYPALGAFKQATGGSAK